MNNRNNDINDDEIRIISSENNRPIRKKRRWLHAVLYITAAFIAIGGIIIKSITTGRDTEDDISFYEPTVPKITGIQSEADSTPSPKAFTTRRDTLINGAELSILTPYNATATLEIGNGVSDDSTAVLIVQAADIRKDNGMIVGSYVVKGKLISNSESKAGFCSIINGEISVGVADATPMFEQALMSDGYFFRQYPLVVAGQIVENKPKGKAVRKALAEIDGKTSVIISHSKLSFHDFSQALADIGVRNAIYLVGGSSYGRYTDASGDEFIVGPFRDNDTENVNYIVWR